MRIGRHLLGTLLFTLTAALAPAAPLGTAFTYQGRLLESGAPVTGSYDLRLALWDRDVGGSQWFLTLTNTGVAVANGLFTTTLDFGADPFNGPARWLEIGVRTNGASTFVTFPARQPLTPAPYALYATRADNAVAATTATVANAVANNAVTAPGIATGQVVKSLNGLKDAVTLAAGTNVTLATNGNSIVVSSHTWSFTGNSGTQPGVNFLGTTDNQPLEFRVNGTRGLRLSPTAPDADHAGIVNLIGGSPANQVGAGVYGATIGGGGAGKYFGVATVHNVQADFATIGGGLNNGVSTGALYATVSGGFQNRADINAFSTTISGGMQNWIKTNAPAATIGGGRLNRIGPNSEAATIGGGDANLAAGPGASIGGGGFNGTDYGGNVASGAASTIAGGYLNVASGTYATVGGGDVNTADANAFYATIGGGRQNWIRTNAPAATIGGGRQNSIAPNAESATIGGGYGNRADGPGASIGGGGFDGSNYSGNIASGAAAAIGGGYANVASGTYAAIGGGDKNTAGDNWATVGGGWGNQASGRAATVPGGYDNQAGGWYSFAAGRRAKTTGQGSFVWGDSTDFDIWAAGANEFVARATGGFYFFTAVNRTNGFPAAGVQLHAGDPGWQNWSDRDAKENFRTADTRQVLDKVCQLPLTEWNMKAQAPSVRHLGPMAQDFHAAFGLGGDNRKSICTVDADGVALAAIQGLNQKLEEKNAALEKQVAELKALVQTLAEKVNGGTQ